MSIGHKLTDDCMIARMHRNVVARPGTIDQPLHSATAQAPILYRLPVIKNDNYLPFFVSHESK